MIIKAVEFPNRTFATKAELFAALKANEEKLISLKKAQVYKSCEKGQISFLNLDKVETIKNLSGAKEGFIYPIVSTTKYMDNHLDVHFNGCFGKTVNEQQGKVCYALDHELKWDSIVAWQKDVKMFISEIEWSLVGKSYSGTTEALIFEIAKDKVTRKDVLEAIEKKVAEFENSVRMTYHKMFLGIDSKDKEYKPNKEYFDRRVNEIANKELAFEVGYFWGVEELGIQKEASLVVAGGSNDATRIYSKFEPGASHSENQPPLGTDKKAINYDYLASNFKL